MVIPLVDAETYTVRLSDFLKATDLLMVELRLESW